MRWATKNAKRQSLSLAGIVRTFAATLSAGLLSTANAGPNGFTPPPSWADAHQAIVDDYYRARGGRSELLLGARQRPGFPYDVDVDRCDWREGRRTVDRSGSLVALNGYVCMLRIYTNAWPALRGPGFFHHDGARWIFFGEIREMSSISLRIEASGGQSAAGR